jgi:hypothetical protein
VDADELEESSGSDDEEVSDDELFDYIAITRLQSAYADAVSRRAWAEVRSLFLPAATVLVDTVTAPPVELVGPAAVARFIEKAVEAFEFFEFVNLNSHVTFGEEDDAARARIFICELRQDAASGRWTNTFGVYHDRYQLADGRWLFAERRYHSLARSGRAEVFQFPHHLGGG